MEKINFPPLIAHLRDQHAFYNQLYLDHELKYGKADGTILHKWIAQAIEPVVIEITKDDADKLPAVFKAFYSELLKLTGSRVLISNENEYRALWQACVKMPVLLRTYPAKILTALHAALQSVRMFQPAMTLKWIELMDSSVAVCVSFEDLLHCGRMNAWFCGLAHLREKCKEQFNAISPALKNKLQEHCTQPVEKLLEQSWLHKKHPLFIDAPGGFTGLSGAFTQPPLLKDAGGYVLATDNESSFLLFADEFGSVLHPTQISGSASTNSLKIFEKQFGSYVVLFDDVSSCVLQNNTLFVTRYSSHYIYIYGWSNEN